MDFNFFGAVKFHLLDLEPMFLGGHDTFMDYEIYSALRIVHPFWEIFENMKIVTKWVTVQYF